MPKSARTSRHRRSSHYNILNDSSDFDNNKRRDSKWWRNLSDRSIRRSVTGDIRSRTNENAILSDGSYPYGDVDSRWWQQLDEDESTILQRNALKNRNKSNSVVEEDEKTAHESHTEHSYENVARKTLFTDRQLRSGNHRFSKAFHLEQDQISEPQVTQEETDAHNNGETTNEKTKSAETIPRTRVKVKRKTIQLFNRKPYSQSFSEAFHTADEEKIEDQQNESNRKSQVDNEEQHSEIIVPATQESQETHRKSLVVTVQDTLGNIGEENSEVNETLVQNKTNLETSTHVEKKNLFTNTQDKKRTFSAAFSKTAVDETGVDTNEEPKTIEKVSENPNDTIDTEINQCARTRKGLFEQKQTRSRKFSEAFSKTKHTDNSIDKSNQDGSVNQIDKSTKLVGRKSKSPRKSQIKELEQNKNLEKISEEILGNEQTENVDNSTITVRKSSRLSKNNDSNQMEMSENIEIKQNLFQTKIKGSRKFSEAFADTKKLEKTSAEEELTNIQEEKSIVSENSRITRKSPRISKNNTNQMEVSENIKMKQNLFQAKIKESRKFSDAFTDTTNLETTSAEKELSNKQDENSIAIENSRITRKSPRISKPNETNQMEINENVPSKNLFNKVDKKESQKFSEAFDKSKITEQNESGDNLPDNEGIERESVRRSKRSSKQKSELLTISRPSEINTNDENISVRKLLRSSKINETNQMEISENIQTKQDLFKAKVKEIRKFSDAFTETRIIEKSSDEKELSDRKERDNNIDSVSSKINERKSIRTSENNSINHQTDTSEMLATKKDLFENKIKENRKFSDAFAKSTYEEKMGNKSNEYQEMHGIKSSAENKTDQPNDSSRLSTLPSINDTVGDDKKALFKPKARKSLFSLRNTPNHMKKIDENAAVEYDPNTQSSPAELTNGVFSDSVTSKFFETSLISSTKLVVHPNMTRRNSMDDSQVEENQNENKNKSQSKKSSSGSKVPPQGTFMQTENVEHPEPESSQKESDEPEAQINKDKSQSKRSLKRSNIPPQETSMQTDNVDLPEQEFSQKEIDEPQNKSELTKNKGNVQSIDTSKKAPNYTSAVENSKTKTSFKNTSKRTTLSNEDNLKESQLSPNPGKRSSKFITDDIQTYISNNKSSRASTLAENTDKTTQDKFETRTSPHKNTSKFNLNDIEKNVTDKKLNRVSVQQDTDKNATETRARKSDLKYSTNLNEISHADRQSDNTSHKKTETAKKSLQSEYGENEKSKKSMSRTETNMSKKVLRFTENYENEIIDEDEDETLNSNVSYTNSASKSNVTGNKSKRIFVQQDTDKNSTEIQTHSRKSNLKYSTNLNELSNANRQSNTTKSNKESVRKSLQSEYGENEKSKKSMSRTETDMSKILLKFTENYENEIINENEDKTLNSNVSKPSLMPIRVTERKSKDTATLKPKNVNKTPVINDKKLQMQKELLLKAMNEMKQTTSRITTEQLPSKKITDFFSKINFNERPKSTQNKVTKRQPKPIPTAQLINGQIYRPKKLFSGERWCNKRFYKYLQNKLHDKYGETTIVESENVMKSIASSVKIISKSKKYAAKEIATLRKELARYNVISTTFDFYQLIENFLPYNIREKVVPCTRAHYAEPSVPYDHEGLFKTIEI